MDVVKWIYFEEKVETMIDYLSGAMEFASDEGSTWRAEMTKWLDENLNHGVYNPVIESSKLITEYGADDYRIWKKTDTEKYAKFIRICIDNDINIVRNHADYIICLWDRNVFKGAGTHAEVTIAYELKKPVYLVNKISELDLSGWIMACSTKIFDDFKSLKHFLLERYNEND